MIAEGNVLKKGQAREMKMGQKNYKNMDKSHSKTAYNLHPQI